MSRPKNIKRKIIRSYYYLRNLAHLQHYRGFGVHSPFVYGIVRHSLMEKHRLAGTDKSVFNALAAMRVSSKRATQLQNLYTWCAYKRFFILTDTDNSDALDDTTICFVMPSLPESETFALAAKAKDTGCAICLMAPYESHKRSKLCHELIRRHTHTSIDNRGFMLMFCNPRQPKQHFKL